MFNIDQPTYQRLRLAHAERHRPIAFWIGAGFSAPAELPTWPKLRDILVEEAMEGLAGLTKPEAELKEEALERARTAVSLWDAFESIKGIMGRAEFNASVRGSFGGAERAEAPEAYKNVWQLPGVSAVLTLNVDGFANKAHRRIRTEEDPVIFNGRDAPSYTHLLGARRPFIANLHGVLDDQTSWVFTRTDVNQLFSNQSYQDFLAMVFSSMTVVFAGISAEDGAAGGTLAKLTERGMDLGAHYWITDRPGSHEWAAKAGLQIIRYSPETTGPETERHAGPLRAMFTNLLSFTSRDVRAATVMAKVQPVDTLPTSRELRIKDEDELRRMLSGYAKKLLNANGSDTEAADYTNFLTIYSANIHQAWHITADPPMNSFYGYKVVRQVHGSPFSTVWELAGFGGEQLALKLLRIENLRSGPQIESFRRGVKSLEYLTGAAVPGTAALIAAFEIPTAVIMEYIDGASLADVAHAGVFDPWPDILLIMANVCRHLIYSHNLPQGVLHRDVRPSNIMLPYVYWNAEDAAAAGHSRHDVALLNYDMSWHSSAAGRTITGSLEEAGYYAPEQLADDGAAARTTLVDSYGIGMCLFYAFARKSPPTAGSKSKDWELLLTDGIRLDPRLQWRSAPTRLRRLIYKATRPDPQDRPSVTQIEAELRLLANAFSGDLNGLPIDFWAEELISRSEEAPYDAAPNGFEFVRTPRPGRTVTFGGDVKAKAVVLTFRNQAMDSTNRSGMDRMWKDKLQRAKDVLGSHGWEVVDSRYASMEILVTAHVTLNELKIRFDRVLEGLKRGVTLIRIE